MNATTVSADLMSAPLPGMKQGHSCPPSPVPCHMGISIANYTPTVATELHQDGVNFLSASTASSSIGQISSRPAYSMTGTPMLASDDRSSFSASGNNADHPRVGATATEQVDGLALSKDSVNSVVRNDQGLPADDSKVLANPKGIIKSYLPQAAAMDAVKFAAYRDLCFAHVDEYHKHQKGGIWAQCRICRGTFRHWNTLQRHLQSHIDFRPFACTSCGRAFYSQSKLKRHAIVHSDVKPYPCPVCDRRLGRTEHLKRHLLVHTDAKPYGCSACAHTTKRLDGIRRHIKRKHGATGGAEIIGLETPPTAHNSSVPQPVSSTDDPSEPPKPKAKKKKKKRKKTSTPPPSTSADTRPNGDATKSDAPSLMDVAMQFGINDLRIPQTSGEATAGRYFAPESPVPPPKDMSRYAVGQVQSADDLKQMQLLYQSLARSHASSSAAAAHVASSPNSAPGRPVNILAPAHLAQPHPFAASHQQRHTALQLPHPAEHPGFLVNTGVAGATAMPAAAMRYVPVQATDASGRATAVNPVIFAPAAGGHFSGADADMISQYIQSQQRFVPPVWGIATNPNFPNYGWLMIATDDTSGHQQASQSHSSWNCWKLAIKNVLK